MSYNFGSIASAAFADNGKVGNYPKYGSIVLRTCGSEGPPDVSAFVPVHPIQDPMDQNFGPVDLSPLQNNFH